MAHKHRTPTTLDLATRLGRLTLGHIAAIVVGGVTLLLLGKATAGVADLGHHFALVVFPTIAVCAPILALTRGGIERYPQQSARYAARLAVRCGGRGAAWLIHHGKEAHRALSSRAQRWAQVWLSRAAR